METRATHLGLYGTIALTMLSGCLDAVVGEPFECAYDGKRYQVGDDFKSTDGCNDCSCGLNGEVACTERACVPRSDGGRGDAGASDGVTSDGGTCDYGGRTYVEGQRFAAEDGCNSCTCTRSGAQCTLVACQARTCSYEGRMYDLGSTFAAPDGCNTCTCGMDGTVSCTERGCAGSCVVRGAVYRPGQEIRSTNKDETCFCGTRGEIICQKSCTYGDALYRSGESFPAADGCNSCTCNDGQLACTEAACGGTCSFEGRSFRAGENFTRGCSTCTCGMDGVVSCKHVCDPTGSCPLGNNAFPNGTSVTCEDGCNVCLCTAGTWSSTDAACPPLPRVKRCDPSVGVETYQRVVYLSGNALAVEAPVGCDMAQTAPDLCWDGSFTGNEPLTARLRLTPPAANCTTSSTRTFVYDLNPVREAYLQTHQVMQGSVLVSVGMSSALYSF